MQGTDLSRVLLGRTDRGPHSAFLQFFVPFAGDGTPQPWRGPRTAHYLYARTEAGPWGLYDLADDPYMMRNLAHHPGHAELLKGMDATLTTWMRRTGDTWTSSSTAPVDDRERLYRFETFYAIQECLDREAKHPELAPRD